MAIADSVTGVPALCARATPAVRAARVYFLLLAGLGLMALLLGVENRLTPGLFPVAPLFDLLPPVGEQAWYQAFLLHQQDPTFAACGGAESFSQFKLLYWWEWLRRASFMLAGAAFAAGLLIAAALPEFRFTLPRHFGLGLIGLCYLLALRLLGIGLAHVPDLARYNVGQYGHAIDLTFASLALALVIASVVAPPTASRPRRTLLMPLIGLIVLAIVSGALFAARDAITVWRSFPGYEGGALPPLGRLIDYSPVWLNFTFNQYMIQFVHRGVGLGLGVALLVFFVAVCLRERRLAKAVGLLLALVVAEIAAGALVLNLSSVRATYAVSALAHELGAVALLAAAFAIALRTRSHNERASAPPRGEGLSRDGAAPATGRREFPAQRRHHLAR
jgi:heme a synthase